jgi:hypothetical protein
MFPIFVVCLIYDIEDEYLVYSGYKFEIYDDTNYGILTSTCYNTNGTKITYIIVVNKNKIIL